MCGRMRRQWAPGLLVVRRYGTMILLHSLSSESSTAFYRHGTRWASSSPAMLLLRQPHSLSARTHSIQFDRRYSTKHEIVMPLVRLTRQTRTCCPLAISLLVNVVRCAMRISCQARATKRQIMFYKIIPQMNVWKGRLKYRNSMSVHSHTRIEWNLVNAFAIYYANRFFFSCMLVDAVATSTGCDRSISDIYTYIPCVYAIVRLLLCIYLVCCNCARSCLNSTMPCHLPRVCAINATVAMAHDWPRVA